MILKNPYGCSQVTIFSTLCPRPLLLLFQVSFHPSFPYGIFSARFQAALQDKEIYADARIVNQEVFALPGNILIFLQGILQTTVSHIRLVVYVYHRRGPFKVRQWCPLPFNILRVKEPCCFHTFPKEVIQHSES